MNYTCTLDRLPAGSSACIKSLRTEGIRRRRLLDLGFVPGAHITALQIGPWGDPVAYGIRGAVIALRNEDAAGIYIERDSSHG